MTSKEKETSKEVEHKKALMQQEIDIIKSIGKILEINIILDNKQ